MGVAKQAELEHASHFLGAGSGLTSGACPVRGRGSSRVRWPRELDPTRAGMEVAGVGSSLLSGACVFFTLCMFSSSLSDLRHIWMTQNVDRVQFLPFLVMDVNTLGWLSYGALKGDWTIIIVNVVGAVLQTLYVLVYLHYSPRKVGARPAPLAMQTSFPRNPTSIAAFCFSCRKHSSTIPTLRTELLKTATLLGVFLLAFSYFWLLVPKEVQLQHLGLLCSFCTICMYLSPMAELAKVIQTKSTQRLSLPLTIASLFSSACWTLYGFQLGDPYIMMGIMGLNPGPQECMFYWVSHLLSR
ncbi:sugar transporter SWEET1 isoform X2 [Erinaceus europaeus]|uniref:Sugar transporter SWEET n=1 Tax=Erinaceus europaeus TaxID=9365 RepID=A0ABM3Y909_ERIEU|nr:sugar transporter SWEET1 isoform X2 [Erinaceus europaeus]